jgi:hypothetical protein
VCAKVGAFYQQFVRRWFSKTLFFSHFAKEIFYFVAPTSILVGATVFFVYFLSKKRCGFDDERLSLFLQYF